MRRHLGMGYDSRPKSSECGVKWKIVETFFSHQTYERQCHED